jgi:peptidoglycan/xylan/chitin deacetylase (PgdA/CDA1 family)
MFESSHPFAFFDYFRVPYEITLPKAAPEGAEASKPVGRLRTVGEAGGDGRTLFWLRPGKSPRMRSKAFPLGRYKIDDCTLFCHVAVDATVPGLLRGLGRGWHPDVTVLGSDGQPAAAIWRDEDGSVFLPFDPGEVMHYFWSEKYRSVGQSSVSALARASALRSYYLARPVLPRPVQLQLRRTFTRVQGKSSFPGWPIEDALHNLYEWLFALIAEFAGNPVPYVDLWPAGRSWALVLTHDVETDVGYRDMERLRSLERERGYKSSWNFVPLRYRTGDDVVRTLQAEGCEVGVHGLRHDGRDLGSRRLMERRLPAMRAHAQRWNAVGFRSPGTQRHWALMPLLGFEYDSSYSDTDPYEPQPGGCCTYLPYINGGQVELPITMAQDHTLFAILQHPEANVWLRKAHLLRERRGMVLVLTHPDYTDDLRIVDGYRKLLDEFKGDETVWHALPREVAAWWRRRAASRIRERSGRWHIEGPASADGRVRFAAPHQHRAYGEGAAPGRSLRG